MAQCEKCGKQFNTDHALKVHMGIRHGKGKAAKKRKAARKAKASHGRKAGKLACPECDRTFSLAMHLARHRSAAHGAAAVRLGRKPGRRPGGKPGPKPGGRVASAARSALAELTIDQLLTLRSQIDARLTDIARQMRQANIKF
jgi:hypothetical protein